MKKCILAFTKIISNSFPPKKLRKIGKSKMLAKNFSYEQLINFLVVSAVTICIKNVLGLFVLYPIGPTERFGLTIAILIFVLRTISLIITSPFIYFGVLASLFYTAKQPNSKPRIPESTICFRVVTRGMFPQMVNDNLNKHMSLFKSYEGLRYTYEIVTDMPVYINNQLSDRIFEVLVPSDYNTKSGAKYKARALQYAIEKNVSNLTDDDWVVHLDEESLMTKSSLNGIIEFVNKNKHPIGQGLICYGKCGVVNWTNTLADCLRSANDLGSLRFNLKS